MEQFMQGVGDRTRSQLFISLLGQQTTRLTTLFHVLFLFVHSEPYCPRCRERPSGGKGTVSDDSEWAILDPNGHYRYENSNNKLG